VKDKKVDYKLDSLQCLSVSFKIMRKDELGAECYKRRGIRNRVHWLIRHPVYNVRYTVVPINSSLLTVTLYSFVMTKHDYNDIG